MARKGEKAVFLIEEESLTSGGSEARKWV